MCKKKQHMVSKNPMHVVAHKDAHRLTAHRCAGGLKEKLDQQSGPHATGFSNVKKFMAWEPDHRSNFFFRHWLLNGSTNKIYEYKFGI